jgi:hypothetical protein
MPPTAPGLAVLGSVLINIFRNLVTDSCRILLKINNDSVLVRVWA